MRTSGAGLGAESRFRANIEGRPRGKSRLSENRRRVLARRQALIRRSIIRGAYATLAREESA